jgi:hypothetical protein
MSSAPSSTSRALFHVKVNSAREYTYRKDFPPAHAFDARLMRDRDQIGSGRSDRCRHRLTARAQFERAQPGLCRDPEFRAAGPCAPTHDG